MSAQRIIFSITSLMSVFIFQGALHLFVYIMSFKPSLRFGLMHFQKLLVFESFFISFWIVILFLIFLGKSFIIWNLYLFKKAKQKKKIINQKKQLMLLFPCIKKSLWTLFCFHILKFKCFSPNVSKLFK